jgi:hypothetical protein
MTPIQRVACCRSRSTGRFAEPLCGRQTLVILRGPCMTSRLFLGKVKGHLHLILAPWREVDMGCNGSQPTYGLEAIGTRSVLHDEPKK